MMTKRVGGYRSCTPRLEAVYDDVNGSIVVCVDVYLQAVKTQKLGS